jgi:hypothetical protein
MRYKARFLLASLVVLTLISGCGPKNPNASAAVSGKVTYKGAGLPAGAIMFQPKEGAPVTTALDENGNYTIPEMPAGDFIVIVDTEGLNPAKKPPTYGQNDKGSASPAPQGSPTSTGKYVKIPDKYSNPTATDLKATIVAGKQTKDFELKD